MEHGAYFKTKAFAWLDWVLNQTCELDRKYKKKKKARPVDL